jgi:hypothetical protein
MALGEARGWLAHVTRRGRRRWQRKREESLRREEREDRDGVDMCSADMWAHHYVASTSTKPQKWPKGEQF